MIYANMSNLMQPTLIKTSSIPAGQFFFMPRNQNQRKVTHADIEQQRVSLVHAFEAGRGIGRGQLKQYLSDTYGRGLLVSMSDHDFVNLVTYTIQVSGLQVNPTLP